MHWKIRNPALIVAIVALFWAAPASAANNCTERITTHCTGCHYPNRICEKIGRKSRRDWKVTVKRMLRYGLQLNGTGQDLMLDCLQGLEKDRGELCK
jgi:hypothetical protein